MATKTIERGTTLLDMELGPGWVHLIGLDRLDMAKGPTCVIGQTHGGAYSYGIEKVLGRSATVRDQQKHGFMTWNFDPYSWQRLTMRWKRHIRKLQTERHQQ